MQAIIDILVSIGDLFGTIGFFITTIISGLLTAIEYINRSISDILVLTGFMPSVITSAVLLTITIAVVNRLTVGIGGG